VQFGDLKSFTEKKLLNFVTNEDSSGEFY